MSRCTISRAFDTFLRFCCDLKSTQVALSSRAGTCLRSGLCTNLWTVRSVSTEYKVGTLKTDGFGAISNPDNLDLSCESRPAWSAHCRAMEDLLAENPYSSLQILVHRLLNSFSLGNLRRVRGIGKPATVGVEMCVICNISDAQSKGVTCHEYWLGEKRMYEASTYMTMESITRHSANQWGDLIRSWSM